MNLSAAVGAGLVFFAAHAALAQDNTASPRHYKFDIPATTVDRALFELARETGKSLMLSSEGVEGERSRAVNGVYTLSEALSVMLQGTHLVGGLTGSGVITISHRDQGCDTGGSMPQQLKGSVSVFALLTGILAGANCHAQATGQADAAASQGIETVTVTAEKRAESVQAVPSSITALSADFIKQSGAIQLEDIIHAVPGVAYTENSVGQAVLAIRGIQTSATFPNTQAPVALYYDEVPVLDPLIAWNVPQLQLFDASRVEVLRGPQGTLFGAGSLSGTMRIITNKPDLSQYEASTEDTVTSTEGGNAGYAVDLMGNIPIIQNELAVRAVGYYDYIGGWIDNPTLGEKDGNHAAIYGGRAEVTWRPTENLDVTATFAQDLTRPNDSNYLPYGSRTYVANNRLPIYDDDDTKIYNLVANYTMSWATLTSSTSYVDRDAFSALDFSGTSHLVTHLTAVSPLNDEFKTGNFMQEVRLASADEHPLKWLVGSFIQSYDFALCEQITQAGVSGLGYSTNYLEDSCTKDKIVDQAGFADASYDIFSQLTLSAGVRYSHYSVGTGSQHSINGADIFGGPPGYGARAATYDALTPKISLSYTPDQNVMFYLLADRGYRNGFANLNTLTDPINGQPLPAYYRPDHLWNYELGTKTELLDDRLVVNADVYYIDWSDIILGQVAAGGINFVGNAGDAIAKGAELELVAKPTAPSEIGVSLDYSDAKMTSIGPGVSATVGDQLPGSAPFSAYLYGQYDFPVLENDDLSLRMDYSYTGREYSLLNNYHNPAALHYGDYSALGAQTSLHFANYEIMLFVRNLADGKGRIGARTLYNEPAEILQVPRTVGITFRAHL